MAVYFITGKLGSGKTLCAVGRIRDYVNRGCKVATNLDIDIAKLVDPFAKKSHVYRIPDKPDLADLQAIGVGNDTYDESKNGLLVLDECGTWFNSRTWADKERQLVINWFLHARKKGWDIIFIIQDIHVVDKQARLMLAEHVVYCRRLDRLKIPFIGTLWKLIFQARMPLPQFHLAIVKYGDQPTSLTVDRWLYRGTELYQAYDTKQAFSDFYESKTYRLLTPFLMRGRYMVPRDRGFYMRMTRIYFKRFGRSLLLTAGIVLGLLMGVQYTNARVSELQDQIEASNAIVEFPETELSSVPLDKPNFAEMYADYYIAGYLRSADRIVYQVTNGRESITMDAMRNKGHLVKPRGSCELLVTNPDDRSDYVSIYARDCFPEESKDPRPLPPVFDNPPPKPQQLYKTIDGRVVVSN